MTGPPAGRRLVAVVTGAARGIGAATALHLADQGYRVVAVDSCEGAGAPTGYPLATRGDLDAVGAALGERGTTAVADVTDPEAMRHVVAEATRRHGSVDVAVAAAAVIAGGRPQWEDPSLELLWRVDVAGVWNTAAAVVPAMLDGPDPGRCRLVAVASAAGARGLFHLAAYTTVKHAVVGLVRGLAADLVGTGVTVAAVSPGGTRTAMLDATAALYGVGVEDLARAQLLQDLLDPAEVAATIGFCCSAAGRALNGSVVAADGGFAG